MLNNQLKTAYRHLLRHRSYTIINIAGLAAGVAVALLIFVYIRFQTSYDDFHSKKDRIYRVETEFHPVGSPVFVQQAVPAPLPRTIRQDFPQLTSSGVLSGPSFLIQVLGQDGGVEKKFIEPSGFFAVEPSFFDIFDFPWLAGNPATSLANTNSAVLTKEIAEKYFGDWKKAMGRTIRFNTQFSLTVTGILATAPANTDFQLKLVVPLALAGLQQSSDWVGTSDYLTDYVLLPPNVSAASLDAPLRAFSKKYRPVDDKDELILGPLSEVHTYNGPNSSDFSGLYMRPDLIRALWLIAAFILLIACVNFINLSTADSVNRAREVGVRKVLGGNRGQLRRQFLLETLLIVGGGVVLALGLAALALPMVAKIVDLPLSAALLRTPAMLLFLLAVIAAVTLLAGWYPSVVMSRFNPSKVLRSKVEGRAAKGISLRRSLVVLQFVIAQALIISTLVLIRQMNFFLTAPMGFDKDAVFSAPIPYDSVSVAKRSYLRNRLLELPGVSQVSYNNRGPADLDDNNNYSQFMFDRATKMSDWYTIVKFADENYLGTYRIPLVEGTNFGRGDSSVEFLVTQAFAKRLGMQPQDVLHKQLTVQLNLGQNIMGPIVGVLEDFHATSMKDAIAPVVITKMKGAYNRVAIKLSGADIPRALTAIEKLWDQVYPDFVFQYQFLDQHIADFYKSERQLSQLYQFFAAIAIFLSCLGLYGLASFMAAQRIREVGIRKVLGASERSIIVLFSKEFVVLIGIALVIAAPLAGWYMHSWLQDYPYRVNLSWWIFAVGGGLSVLVALGTVSFRAMRAARANPVQALKSE